MTKQLEYFLTVDENYWINLLRTYLVEVCLKFFFLFVFLFYKFISLFQKGKHICIRAYPSIEEQERLSKIELDRIEKQRNELGIEGLQQKGNELKKAMEENEVCTYDYCRVKRKKIKNLYIFVYLILTERKCFIGNDCILVF